MREKLFEDLSGVICNDALFETDGHSQYASLIGQHYPEAEHQVHPSIRGCVAGQGELKKIQHDPLFAINHTLAMLRANINRLVRRTWCTTKNPAALLDHLWIYVHQHNQVIRKQLAR